jgi:hypothetical protein
MSDPVTQALDREAQERLPFIAVVEFRTDYKPQPDGSQKPIEWVSWVKKGVQGTPPITEEKISRLMKSPENPIWQVIKPYYDRWKEGQGAPIDGTPLAAWPGATPQLVKALEPANIRSVEDLARMEDSSISKLAIPHLREKQKQARAYLEAMISTSAVASENLKLRETVEAMQARMAELEGALKDMEAEEEAPKRRGRPPKMVMAN